MRCQWTVACALMAASASASTIGLGLKRRAASAVPSQRRLLRRDDDDTLDLKAMNELLEGGYFSEIEVGTPPQKMTLHLDTGSSDTWLNSSFFSKGDSSTYQLVEEDGFDIEYLDGTTLHGDYFNDTITIDGEQITNQQLGLTSTIDDSGTAGLMGLGYSAGVSANKTYPAIVDNMVSRGLIKRAAYSLYLNDLSSDAGSILFGAIDTKKFIGDLATIPILTPADGDILQLFTRLHGVGISEGDDFEAFQGVPNSETDFTTTIMDSGSTLSILSVTVISEMMNKIGIYQDPITNLMLIDCKYGGDAGKDITVDFDFGNKTIKVPIEELTLNTANYFEKRDVLSSVAYRLSGFLNIKASSTEVPCIFGIQPATLFGISADNFSLLGDTFLRSAYVVYDLANDQIGIAQANLNATESNIVELEAGQTTLPSVSGEQSQTGTNSGDMFRAPVVTVCLAVVLAVVSHLLY